MRRIALMLTVAAVLGSTAGSLLAQPPGGPGGGRGRGGGGFGGPTGLLMIPEVRAELKVTDEQHQKLRTALEGLRSEGGGGQRGGFGNLSEEERAEMRKRMEELQKKTDEAMKSVLSEEQITRLRQLDIQRQGAQALGRPDVAEKLGLTDEQKTKMREIQEAARPDFSAFGNLRDASPEEREKVMSEMRSKREKADADVMALLDTEQKAIWESLIGEKFNFPAQQFGGGFGGGRGQRGSGGGRPPGAPQ